MLRMSRKDNFIKDVFGVITVKIALFLILSLILGGLFTAQSFALQQVAGKIQVDIKPGETKTFQWTLISDNDKPTDVKISTEGKGSEFLSFEHDVTLAPKGSANVEFTVNIPNDYPGGVELTPSLFATEFGQKGGTTVLNIQMLKIPSIVIAPNENPEFRTNSAYDTSTENAKSSVTPEPVAPKITPEPVAPEPTTSQPSGGLSISQPTQPTKQTQQPTSQKGGGCLIATAAFGSELAPQVQLLREVRDNVLFSTSSGTTFMSAFNNFYYAFSPAVADIERDNPAFKELVKTAITPMLSTLSILHYVNIDSDQQMLGYGIGIILLNIGMYFVAPVLVVSKLRKTYFLKKPDQ